MQSRHKKPSNDQLTVWLVISPLIIAVAHFIGLFVNTSLLKGFLPFSYFLSFISQYLLYWIIYVKLGNLKLYWPILTYSVLLMFGITGFTFFEDTRFLFECLVYIGIGYFVLVLHRIKALSAGLTMVGIQAVSIMLALFLLYVYEGDIFSLTNYQHALAQKEKTDAVVQASLGKQLTFTLGDLAGDSLHSQDLTGKVVVMDFWATWCKPCLAAYPQLEKLHEVYAHRDDVVFLWVNTLTGGDTHPKVEKLIAKKEYGLPLYFNEGNSILESLHINSIPTVVILDDNQRVGFVQVGFSSPETYYKTLDEAISSQLVPEKEGVPLR